METYVEEKMKQKNFVSDRKSGNQVAGIRYMLFPVLTA